MTPEVFIRNQICSWLTRQKCFFFLHDSVGIYDTVRKRFRTNTSPYRMKGVSDILGLWKGKGLAIEVKAGKGRLSKEQKLFLELWTASGGIGIAAWSVEDVKNALDKLVIKQEE